MKHAWITLVIMPLALLFTAGHFPGCTKEKKHEETAAIAKQARTTVAGKVVDVYTDEEAGEVYVTLETESGKFVVDCKEKSFDTPIGLRDLVKVSVDNVRIVNATTVGDLQSVIEHTPSR